MLVVGGVKVCRYLLWLEVIDTLYSYRCTHPLTIPRPLVAMWTLQPLALHLFEFGADDLVEAVRTGG